MTNTTTLIPNGTLITKTPEEGRTLAMLMSRLVIKTLQPDNEIRMNLREIYATDATMLIMISQIVATEFATIAAANNYWKKD
ncbi:hexameric tyrosine-coordinated heme protein [Flavobacterium branchiophilum]|uniref:Hexameric tyrosine-coordinated heme protein (HTHP) n=2 Tax=Flavobacterium branchiophilum TaxID=55197 RepID=G2Z4K5_FLABF|nr:hexameric tyrosine-coordinated heme protein [Flavobacterium branchiophilum]PDS24444.1 hypothetical protein B0A77_07885 [Flavobacterium branchiophilum]CCB68480.1 Protein of unknown function [Flavobacterium branchiophilum FL-15]